jgi:outer membrane protein insertion porin family
VLLKSSGKLLFGKIKQFGCICLCAIGLDGCLGTRYLNDNEKLLYNQSIKTDNKNFDAAPLADLTVTKTNRRLFGLPVNHLVWMHHMGEKKYDQQKFIRKKEKIEKAYTKKLAKVGSQRAQTNLQYRRSKKVDAIEKKIENGNNFMQWGEKAALYDSASIVLTAEKIHTYLFAKGYFLNAVDPKISEKNRKVSVVYKVSPKRPYRLDSIVYITTDTLIRALLDKDKSNQVLKKRQIYDQDKFGKERERIDLLLRDNGYYNFNRQYIDFQVDTTLTHPRKVAVRVNIQKPERTTTHQRFRIDSLIFVSDVGIQADSGKHRQTIFYQGISFQSYRNQFHPKALRPRVFINHDSLYSRSNTFQTQRQLASLDIFKFVNINYDTIDGRFIANIFASPMDRYSWGNEAGVSVTQGFPGPYYSLNFKKRNLFGGLEIFELNGRYGIEGVASATQIGNFLRSTEANVNASITYPQFLFPMSGEKAIRLARLNPRTKLLAGYTYTNRPEYQRNIITASGTYTWEHGKNFLYSLTALNLNVIKSDTSAAFGTILRDLESNGNRLINAFKPSLVSSMIFSVTWNQHGYGTSDKSSFYIRASAESGGTFLNLFEPAIIKKEGLQPYKYLRLSMDVRRTQIVNKHTQLAFRFNSGVGYAYSDNKVLPYEKYFFAGGSNSVRAWRPRRLGQGTLPPALSTNPSANGYFDYRFEKPGDLLIEASAEFRQKLFGFVNYALFIDAGNVWTLSSNSNPLTKFTPKEFYKEFGVGTGFGLRFDFTFLILRLDMGIKAFDPARPAGDRFVLNRAKFFKPFGTDREPVIFNIGIGYPF